jgi:hypothetical protein
MNKRIQLLAQQATTIEYGIDNGFDRVTFDKEKFAELIVRECVDVVKWTPSIFPNDTIIKNIKEHFGVEE